MIAQNNDAPGTVNTTAPSPTLHYFDALSVELEEGARVRSRLQQLKDDSLRRLQLLREEKSSTLARLDVTAFDELTISPEKRADISAKSAKQAESSAPVSRHASGERSPAEHLTDMATREFKTDFLRQKFFEAQEHRHLTPAPATRAGEAGDSQPITPAVPGSPERKARSDAAGPALAATRVVSPLRYTVHRRSPRLNGNSGGDALFDDDIDHATLSFVGQTATPTLSPVRSASRPSEAFVGVSQGRNIATTTMTTTTTTTTKQRAPAANNSGGFPLLRQGEAVGHDPSSVSTGFSSTAADDAARAADELARMALLAERAPPQTHTHEAPVFLGVVEGAQSPPPSVPSNNIREAMSPSSSMAPQRRALDPDGAFRSPGSAGLPLYGPRGENPVFTPGGSLARFIVRSSVDPAPATINRAPGQTNHISQPPPPPLQAYTQSYTRSFNFDQPAVRSNPLHRDRVLPPAYRQTSSLALQSRSQPLQGPEQILYAHHQWHQNQLLEQRWRPGNTRVSTLYGTRSINAQDPLVQWREEALELERLFNCVKSNHDELLKMGSLGGGLPIAPFD